MKIAFVYDAVYPWMKDGAGKMIIDRRLVDEGHGTRQCGVSLNGHHDNFGENHSEG